MANYNPDLINVDNVLTVIRLSRENLKDHWLLDAFRTPLMRGDVAGFWEVYSNASANEPDAFDVVTDEMYANCGAVTFDDFVNNMSET